jgi:hypothetical protein
MIAVFFVPGIYDDCVVMQPGLPGRIYDFKIGKSLVLTAST